VTLEAAAEELAATAGIRRQMLVPLVRATVENWASLGGELALTGPVARGDGVTVARQREAVAERTPALIPLFDALTEATRALASAPDPGAPGRAWSPHRPWSPHENAPVPFPSLHAALARARREGGRIGLVPTMGAFHEAISR